MNGEDEEESGTKMSEVRAEALRDLSDSAKPGRFVTLVLADVDRTALDLHPKHSPLIISSLMAHENKMSVMHFLIQKSETTCTDTIQSKDPLGTYQQKKYKKRNTKEICRKNNLL